MTHSNFFSKLKYPLPACTLTELECKSIMYLVIKASLPKSGVLSNISTSMRNGLMWSIGSGVLSSFNYQNTDRTAMVVEQVSMKTPTSMFILQCVKDLVLEAGLYGLLWNIPFGHFSKYTSTYSLILDTFQYKHANQIHMSVSYGELESQHRGDRSLMSIIKTYLEQPGIYVQYNKSGYNYN